MIQWKVALRSLGIIIVVLAFLGYGITVVIMINTELSNVEPTPTQIIYKESTFSSPDFELLWIKQTPTILGSPNLGSVGLVANPNKAEAFMLLSSGDFTTINLVSGEETQHHPSHDTILGPRPSTIAINPGSIFIGFDGTGKVQGNMRWGAGKVEAYDIESGRFLWSQTIPGADSIESLAITEDLASVDGGSSSNYWLLDPKDGRVIESSPKSASDFIWAIENNIEYKRTNEAAFEAFDSESDEVLWRSDYYSVFQPPVFTDDLIIARTGGAGGTGIIIGLDITTGNSLWQYERVYSNVAVNNSTAFFVNKDGQLLAVNIETGEEIGRLQFPYHSSSSPFSSVFHVASSENYVLVHTGDGQQLIAFSISHHVK